MRSVHGIWRHSSDNNLWIFIKALNNKSRDDVIRIFVKHLCWFQAGIKLYDYIFFNPKNSNDTVGYITNLTQFIVQI